MNFCEHFVPRGVDCFSCERKLRYADLEISRELSCHERILKDLTEKINLLEERIKQLEGS